MANELYLFATPTSPNSIGLRSGPAGGGVNVSPKTGALIFTGIAPTVQTPRIVRPLVGTLTITGFAPTVQTPVVVRPLVGALTLTGVAPTVQTPRVILPLSGSLTLTGIAPTVQTPRTVTPSAGALTLVGIAPTVTAGGGTPVPVNVTPSAGELILTGFAPVVYVVPAPTVGGGGMFTPHWKQRRKEDAEAVAAMTAFLANEGRPVSPSVEVAPPVVYTTSTAPWTADDAISDDEEILMLLHAVHAMTD